MVSEVTTLFTRQGFPTIQLHHLQLSQLDTRLLSWYDRLPLDMRWRRWTTVSETLNPELAFLQMTFQTCRLSLKLTLLQSLSAKFIELDAVNNAFKSCNNICDDILGIMERFKLSHGYQRAPMIFVYAAIMASDALLLCRECSYQTTAPLRDTNLPHLETALQGMSPTWSLAESAYIALQQKIKHLYAWGEPHVEPKAGNPPPKNSEPVLIDMSSTISLYRPENQYLSGTSQELWDGLDLTNIPTSITTTTGPSLSSSTPTTTTDGRLSDTCSQISSLPSGRLWSYPLGTLSSEDEGVLLAMHMADAGQDTDPLRGLTSSHALEFDFATSF